MTTPNAFDPSRAARRETEPGRAPRCPKCGRIAARIDHMPSRSTAVCLDGHEWDPYSASSREAGAGEDARLREALSWLDTTDADLDAIQRNADPVLTAHKGRDTVTMPYTALLAITCTAAAAQQDVRHFFAALSSPLAGDASRLLAFIRDECRVVYYPPNGEYPIEHAPLANLAPTNEMTWRMIVNASSVPPVPADAPPLSPPEAPTP